MFIFFQIDNIMDPNEYQKKILEKIEIFWMKTFEIPINSNFDGIEINDSDIRTGNLIALDIILSIASEIDSGIVQSD